MAIIYLTSHGLVLDAGRWWDRLSVLIYALVFLAVGEEFVLGTPQAIIATDTVVTAVGANATNIVN